MKETRAERVYNLIEERGNKLVSKMDNELKGLKPYRQEPIKPLDRLYMFDTMTDDQINSFVGQYGIPSWMNLVSEMDKIRRRYKKNA